MDTVPANFPAWSPLGAASVQGSYPWPLHEKLQESSCSVLERLCGSILFTGVHLLSAVLSQLSSFINICPSPVQGLCVRLTSACFAKPGLKLSCTSIESTTAQKHISITLCTSPQQSSQCRCDGAKDAVLAVGRAEEEAGGATFHCLC